MSKNTSVPIDSPFTSDDAYMAVVFLGKKQRSDRANFMQTMDSSLIPAPADTETLHYHNSRVHAASRLLVSFTSLTLTQKSDLTVVSETVRNLMEEELFHPKGGESIIVSFYSEILSFLKDVTETLLNESQEIPVSA